MIYHKNLIAGEWLDGPTTFSATPDAPQYAAGSADLVDWACRAAEDAFASYSATSRAQRAAFLRKCAEEIDARGDEITATGCAETGLPEARLIGERGRTTGQLKLFADHIEAGDYLDIRHDPALPDRAPLPRPELYMMQRPIGPVAVFGASNFPLAFSTGGGDTASALAAGCPVVVKGHDAHPGTAELVAQAITAAATACDLHPGVFSLVQGGSFEVGQALVTHPLITAVGFTGSLRGGRALFDLCAARPTPIPFFGELGSINPMFILPAALAARGNEIAKGWAGSLTMGAGQFCTNPGVVLLPKGPEAEMFTSQAAQALSEVGPQTMLTDGICDAFGRGQEAIANEANVTSVLGTSSGGRQVGPYLYKTDAATWLESDLLSHEVFGPLGLVVLVDSPDQMADIAKGLEGQLTCTLHLDTDDHGHARALLPLLERKAGRVLANGFPTGVEVADSMVHGGPYPASTNFGATSVGTLAIRRFLRPVCYQGIPNDLLAKHLPDVAL